MTVITPRRALIGAATAGIVLASQPALIASPALILPPSVSEALERRGVVEPHRRAPDIENVLAMLMMAKMMPGVGASGPSGPAALLPQDVFATSLYTGNGSSQTITTGLTINADGGLVWTKARSSNAHGSHNLYDTLRGNNSLLFTNLTDAAAGVNDLDFTSTGFTVKSSARNNINASNYVTWSFRRAPKFFDVVTYTGDGSGARTLSHALGNLPGMVIVKSTSSATNWNVWHTGLSAPSTTIILLNTSDAQSTGETAYFNSTHTTTTFTIQAANNTSGRTYVAYLFAHDTTAGGLVQCGSFTSTGGATASVTLGWRPQFVMFKRTDGADAWYMLDTTRGLTTGSDAYLRANTSQAEASFDVGDTTSTGFTLTTGLLAASAQYVFLAIRAAA